MQTLRGALWKMRAPLGVLAAGGAGAVVLLFVDPNQPGNLLPKCPFNWLTGLNCPACGVTRMAHALLHGDIPAAFHFNAALFVLGIPLAVWAYARWTRAKWRDERLPTLSSRTVTTAMIIAAIWGVARNVAGI